MTIGIKLQNTNPADLNGYRKYAKKKKIATPAGVVFLLAKQYVYKNVMALPSGVIYFGSGIFPLNAAYIKRADCFVVYIGHASKDKSKKGKGKSGKAKGKSSEFKVHPSTALRVTVCKFKVNEES